MPEEVSDQGSRVVSRLYMPQVALCSSPLPPCALAAKSTAERAGNPRGVDYQSALWRVPGVLPPPTPPS